MGGYLVRSANDLGKRKGPTHVGRPSSLLAFELRLVCGAKVVFAARADVRLHRYVALLVVPCPAVLADPGNRSKCYTFVDI